MNKFKKLIVVFVVIIVGIVLFLYPKSFNQIYEDVQAYENGNKVKTVDIKLDGKIHKGYWVWERLKFSKELKGSIIIGDEEYFLHPYDQYMFPDENGNYTDNGIYMCSLYNEENDILGDNDITLYVEHDKSKLYISTDNEEFVYPNNTDDDYKNVRKRMGEDNNDISQIEISLNDTETIIEPTYSKNNFDDEYDEIPVIQTFNRDNTLNFKVINSNLDKLKVVEDYYNVSVDNTGIIEKETYTLNKSDSNDFTLEVKRRGNVKGEKAVYYIYTSKSNTEFFAFQVDFLLE